MRKNIAITMSGGTTTVINSTLAGIVEAAQKSDIFDKIYAGYPGIKGLTEGKLIDLSEMDTDDLEKLKRTPGSGFIGTTRVAPVDDDIFSILKDKFDENSIGYFINIGGNGTIKQTKAISDFFQGDIKVAAVPKTVDNDLGDPECQKVFFTPGFPSCVNFWAKKVQLLNLDNAGAA